MNTPAAHMLPYTLLTPMSKEQTSLTPTSKNPETQNQSSRNNFIGQFYVTL